MRRRRRRHGGDVRSRRQRRRRWSCDEGGGGGREGGEWVRRPRRIGWRRSPARCDPPGTSAPGYTSSSA